MIAPDTIKQLRVGQAVVIQKEPHTAKRAALFKPGPCELPREARHAELEAGLRRTAFERMYRVSARADEVATSQREA